MGGGGENGLARHCRKEVKEVKEESRRKETEGCGTWSGFRRSAAVATARAYLRMCTSLDFSMPRPINSDGYLLRTTKARVHCGYCSHLVRSFRFCRLFRERLRRLQLLKESNIDRTSACEWKLQLSEGG